MPGISKETQSISPRQFLLGLLRGNRSPTSWVQQASRRKASSWTRRAGRTEAISFCTEYVRRKLKASEKCERGVPTRGFPPARLLLARGVGTRLTATIPQIPNVRERARRARPAGSPKCPGSASTALRGTRAARAAPRRSSAARRRRRSGLSLAGRWPTSRSLVRYRLLPRLDNPTEQADRRHLRG
jgi:hypothetical protein